MPNTSQETAGHVQRTGAPVLPKVNLLPPEIREAARLRRFQLAMVGAGVAAVAVVGLLATSAHHQVSQAKANLTSAQGQQSNLQNQLAGLQSVSDVYTQVAAKKAMLARAMGPEIRWSYYLTDLSLKVPDHVWLTNLQATEGGTPTAPTAGSVMTSGIGTVTFAGVAFSHDDVANWLDAIAKERGFTNVYFSSAQKALLGTRNVVNFSSSVSLTQAALSGRYSGEG
jgi:Tfp pilus assembly protein PilN